MPSIEKSLLLPFTNMPTIKARVEENILPQGQPSNWASFMKLMVKMPWLSTGTRNAWNWVTMILKIHSTKKQRLDYFAVDTTKYYKTLPFWAVIIR
jgi:hypothetical protein